MPVSNIFKHLDMVCVIGVSLWCMEVMQMRMSVTIDENLLNQALKVTKAKTKREVIERGLRTLIDRDAREWIADHLGKIDLDLTLDELFRQREER